MKTIILDLDDVVVNMVPNLLLDHNVKYNSDLTIEDINQWKMPRDLIKMFHKPDFFLTLPPIKGAIEGIKVLLDVGYDITIATDNSGSPDIARQKVMWVKAYLPELSKSMMLGAKKHLLHGDVIIDDNPNHIFYSPCHTKIIMDRPWNRKRPNEARDGLLYTGKVCYRVNESNNGWHEILGILSPLKFGGKRA